MTLQPSTLPQDNPVTVIGLGPMGLALAEALVKNGHPTTVWNRTPEKARDLVARGARLAASAADAVAAGPLTIVCLKDYATLYEVLDPAAWRADGPDPGQPQLRYAEGSARGGLLGGRAGRRLPGRRGHGAAALVGDPGSVFLYSGPREVFDAHRATLASLGDPGTSAPTPGSRCFTTRGCSA